jgi:hypothetical protein
MKIEELRAIWDRFADRCTGRSETDSLNYRDFAILVRNAALEEARAVCDSKPCKTAIEKLKIKVE